jgi:hypothetical protein
MYLPRHSARWSLVPHSTHCCSILVIAMQPSTIRKSTNVPVHRPTILLSFTGTTTRPSRSICRAVPKASPSLPALVVRSRRRGDIRVPLVGAFVGRPRSSSVTARAFQCTVGSSTARSARPFRHCLASAEHQIGGSLESPQEGSYEPRKRGHEEGASRNDARGNVQEGAEIDWL